MRLITLKRRSEFLRLRGGAKWVTPAFILTTRTRHAANSKGPASSVPRFGFTVTKKVGSAVVRNRVKRRLKAAVRALEDDFSEPGHDYVLIARVGALKRRFADLVDDLRKALCRVNEKSRAPNRPKRRRPRQTVKDRRADNSNE